LTPEELELVQQTGVIYLMVIGGSQGPPPVHMQVEDPFIKNPFGYCILPYEIMAADGAGTGRFVTVWNSYDTDPLQSITVDGLTCVLRTDMPGFVPVPVLVFTHEMYRTTKFMFRRPNAEEIDEEVRKCMELPVEKWPKLIDGSGTEIKPPARNVNAFLANVFADIPKLSPIVLDTQAPAPKFEQSGTGYDGAEVQVDNIRQLKAPKEEPKV
jgi:hypothetical protein